MIESLGAFARVPVGPFDVAALQPDEITRRVAHAVPAERPVLVYALHVGGLGAGTQLPAVDAYCHADLVYADGTAVTLAMRMVAGVRVRRSPTTDIGAAILREAEVRLGRKPRVALYGGPPGLAEVAGEAMSRFVQVVATVEGFGVPDTEVIDRLGEAAPDFVFVGLGSPREQIWLETHRDALPNAVFITCGGWFGFLAGTETRAPRFLHPLGLEWVWRVLQDPRGKARRYAAGVFHLGSAVIEGRARRAARPSRPASDRSADNGTPR